MPLLPTARRWTVRACAALVPALVLASLLAPAGGEAASSTTVVSADIPSATSLTPGTCVTGQAGVTDFGIVLPDAKAATPTACTLTFGSSNDSSMLQVSQQDGAGVAMYRPFGTTLDTTYGAASSGYRIQNISGWDSASYGLVDPQGRAVAVGRSDGGSNFDATISRFTAAGALDATFGGGDGHLEFDTGSPEELTSTGLDSQGRIVAAGWTTSGGTDRDVLIVRSLPNGTFDPSFGASGKVVVDLFPAGDDQPAGDLAIRADGTIVIAASANNATRTGLISVTDTGLLNAGFAGGGKVSYDVYPGGSEYPNTGVVEQPDGTLLVGGEMAAAFGLMRYSATGTLDLTYGGGDGHVETIPGGLNASGRSMVRQPDGNVVMSGVHNWLGGNHMALVRFTAAGGIDATFATAGTLQLVVGTGVYDSAEHVELLPDGRIVASGDAAPANQDLAVLRLRANGTPDTTFSTTGWKTFDIAGAEQRAYGGGRLTIDGKLIFIGQHNTGTPDLLVARLDAVAVDDYLDDGSADWDTVATRDLFGACLNAVGGGGTAQWTTGGTCPTTDGASWRSVPPSPTKVAYATGPAAAVTASLTFGMRTLTTQPPGTYIAPIAFRVLAPNV